MYLNIHESAIFIADSHFNKKNQQFLIFLKKLLNKQIQTKQLFLMGDMFDFLSSQTKYFINQNQEVIDLLNILSKEIQIVYLEGNHDYNLQALFPHILIIPRKKQPLLASYKKTNIALSHGDNFTNWKYNLFCFIIRNSVFLKTIDIFDYKYKLCKLIDNSLLKKSICRKIPNFDKIVQKRLSFYDCDMVIEGHFHQGGVFKKENKTYINIPSLCCSNKYIKLDELNFRMEDL